MQVDHETQLEDNRVLGRRFARRRRAGACLVLCAIALSCFAGDAGARSRIVPRFRHVVLVVFENKERSSIVGNPDAPTFHAMASRYGSLTSYRAVSHPSLPNYLALVSGSTDGISSDCTSCQVRAPSLADTLARAGLTWKTYAEGLPRPGFLGADLGLYAKKHDPFLYFTDVAERPAWRSRVVPFGDLRADVRSNRLPSFALVVPNLCHDMHDCPIATGDSWLRQNIVPLLAGPELARSVVFVVFDEGATDLGGGGNVAALVLGPLVKPGATSAQPTSHYGLLRTIEDSWGLPALGRSRDAAPIRGIWRS